MGRVQTDTRWETVRKQTQDGKPFNNTMFDFPNCSAFSTNRFPRLRGHKGFAIISFAIFVHTSDMTTLDIRVATLAKKAAAKPGNNRTKEASEESHSSSVGKQEPKSTTSSR